VQALRHPSPRITRTLDKVMSQRRIYVLTTVFLTALCGVHFMVRTWGILHGPQDGDAYSYSWSFQAAMFAMFRLPLWLFGAFVVVLAERSYFTRKNPKRELV
jgi:hypothetical protein